MQQGVSSAKDVDAVRRVIGRGVRERKQVLCAFLQACIQREVS